MHENYHQALQYHGSDGGWAQGPGDDGVYRQGVRFEPLVNCPGVDGGNRHWVASKFLRSDAWLSAITANMPAQLGWIFPAWNASYALDDKSWRWQDQVQLEIYGAQLQLLAPALLAPFPAAHPVATVRAVAAAPPSPPSPCAAQLAKACATDKMTGTEAECEDCVVKAASANCTAAELAFCGDEAQPVRARAWAVPKTNVTSTCTYVVAVNTDEEKLAQFVLLLEPPPPADARANRLFEAGYEVAAGAGGGFSDWIAPGSVNVYGVGTGCKRLPGAPSSLA
eukprot:SAG11_NODE_6593_length_1282_cov_1.201183_1_plen_281_part_00